MIEYLIIPFIWLLELGKVKWHGGKRADKFDRRHWTFVHIAGICTTFLFARGLFNPWLWATWIPTLIFMYASLVLVSHPWWQKPIWSVQRIGPVYDNESWEEIGYCYHAYPIIRKSRWHCLSFMSSYPIEIAALWSAFPLMEW